ncbi:LytR/AlgR family response regulator transcription factor [Gorillibacterium timonense]|uniref:LytR/AlgR family response regulator transcription factor n=1 Tax=Gorillibacterium timonense TaxID=1689269 RepID=UPI00071D58AB|nr:LytTR family DNA-binding domain-containing protein [Gorillibacterium timonense]
MIPIAICDDNLPDTERIEELLLQLQPRFAERIETNIFYSGETFCEAIKDHCPFDIVLMDIEMKGMDGIMAGQKLRSSDDNDTVLLLYISSHDSYYRELFDVQPFAFLDKPIRRDEFSVQLEKAILKTIRRRQEGKRKVFSVSQKGRELLLPLKSLLYFESKIRKIHLHTTEGIIDYYGVLNEEELKLPVPDFVRTHQSYLVNLRYVKEVTSESLILVNNSAIPVSGSRRSAVKDAYLAYRRNFFA